MEETKTADLNADRLKDVSGGVLEEYGKRYIDMLIQNMKAVEGSDPGDLIRKIEQMLPTFFDREIGPEATMEEVSAYVYENWNKF